jgi:hypothetical protein
VKMCVEGGIHFIASQEAAMKVFAVLALLLASASAFVTAPAGSFVARTAASRPATPAAMQMTVFTEAMSSFQKDYPDFAKAGWGPSTKAERWNGR